MGGPCWDGDLQRWRKTFAVDDSGKFLINDETDFEHVNHLADWRQELDAALDFIGQFALAASKLYCDVYPKSNDSGTLSHKEVTMSGFWLSGDNRDRAMAAQPKFDDSTCFDGESLTTTWGEGVGAVYHVNLLKVCRASDLAIFVLNSETAGNKYTPPHPVHSIDPGSLESLSPENSWGCVRL
ncbi:hypothetical protein Z517_04456 [Fonsecaea pedrosoi CBS 271.37]|uniref:Unplaced genomic scaffold supercont1.3, whole genome shotgun sequence n=1 Tax=Fonsecaea pedrosoi CBS 271.37 TaxID=1442368 RepID=A0A0D2DUI9_9EURO|nr:uncharacterized protein Z517_04456 [Fonsecaea pedrosoi CBS 271.37]KIW81431.1 hypothetical protein Z517_04456 [Fonsecaea pedrosoi CBS 271.37]